MDVSVGYAYRIPAPHWSRNQVPKVRQETLHVEVPSVTAAEAPIAITHSTTHGFPNRKSYRWYNGCLYARAVSLAIGVRAWRTITEMRRDLHPERIPGWLVAETQDEGIKGAQRMAENYLVVNKREVWYKTGEPRYVIMTYGSGYNQGGTSLEISNHIESPDMSFSALQRTEAIEAAVKVALARGDVFSAKCIKHSPEIKVKIPEAVKFNPSGTTGKEN